MPAPVQLELPLNVADHITVIEERIMTAVEAADDEYVTKASQKRALDEVSRAHDSVKILAHKVLLLAPRDSRSSRWDDQYYSFPSAHQWKPAKHHELFADMQVIIPYMDQLSELREAIKAAPINPVAPKVDPVLKAKTAMVHKTIWEHMAARKASYDRAVALGELFGGMRVTASAHICYMNNGTQYLRCFYYVDGKLTALPVIVAAAEELKRRQDEKEA